MSIIKLSVDLDKANDPEQILRLLSALPFDDHMSLIVINNGKRTSVHPHELSNEACKD
jgi:type II secretory pathway component PulC